MSALTRARLQTHALSAILAAVLLWLTHSFGGYHPRSWALAGSILGIVAITMLAVRATQGLMLGRWVLVGTGAILALAAWAAVSAQWAVYSAHESWDEAGRLVLYGSVFALGALAASASGRIRPLASWLVAACSTVGLWTVLALRDTDALTLFVSGRLDAPIGYSNSLAAFYFISTWIAIGVAMSADRRAQVASLRGTPAAGIEFWIPPWQKQAAGGPSAERARSLGWLATSTAASAAAAMFFGLGLLTQSRAGIIALAISTVVAVALGPMRVALIARLGALGAIALAFRHDLSEPYQALNALNAVRQAGDTVPPATAQAALNAASQASTAVILMLLLGAASGAALHVLTRLSARWLGPNDLAPSAVLRIACLVFGATATVGLGFAIQSKRDPGGWIRTQVDACRAQQEQAPEAATGSHFATVGTNRCDFWRVAWMSFKDAPVRGIGANNFAGPYAKHRASSELPQQAHSLPLDILAGMGLVGGVLGAAIAVALIAPVVGQARGGWARDPLGLGIGASLAYWLAHASVDWLWNTPAVTIPVIALAGALASQAPSPASSTATRARAPITRSAAAVFATGAVIVLLAALGPLQRADALLREAREPTTQNERPARSLDLAAQAARWQPGWAAPVIFGASLYSALGREDDARRLAVIATQREPGNWFVWSRAATVTAQSDPTFSKRAARRAAQLNPAAAARSAPQPR